MNSCGEGRVPHLLPSTNNHEHIYPKLWISAYHLLVTRDWIRATFTYDTLIPNESEITYRIAIIVREREIHVFYRQRILSKCSGTGEGLLPLVVRHEALQADGHVTLHTPFC